MSIAIEASAVFAWRFSSCLCNVLRCDSTDLGDGSARTVTIDVLLPQVLWGALWQVLRLLGLPEADMRLVTKDRNAARIHVSFMARSSYRRHSGSALLTPSGHMWLPSDRQVIASCALAEKLKQPRVTQLCLLGISHCFLVFCCGCCFRLRYIQHHAGARPPDAFCEEFYMGCG